MEGSRSAVASTCAEAAHLPEAGISSAASSDGKNASSCWVYQPIHECIIFMIPSVSTLQ
jgi:hypothetical protein